MLCLVFISKANVYFKDVLDLQRDEIKANKKGLIKFILTSQ